MVILERGNYKGNVGNILHYFVFCDYQILINSEVEIFISWNQEERIESKAQIEVTSYLTRGRRKGR